MGQERRRDEAEDPQPRALRAVACHLGLAEGCPLEEIRDALEKYLDSEDPGPPETLRERAQALMDLAALENPWDGESAVLVDRALSIDPDNPEALRMQADYGASSLDERLALLDHATRSAEDRIGGPGGLAERMGRVGESPAEKTYLLVRARRASVLAACARPGEAVSEMEDLLRLDPTDRSGVRHALLALRLEQGDLEAFRRLQERFADDGSTTFLWGRVLERFLSEGHRAGAKAMDVAAEANDHVGRSLAEPAWLPMPLPTAGAPGEEDEAALCADLLWPAWAAHPAALEWLEDLVAPHGRSERKRFRRVFEAIRPEAAGDAPLPSYLRTLALNGEGLPDCVLRFVGGRRSEAVPWLVALIRTTDEADDETGFAGSNAAHLLQLVRPPEAVPALSEGLERSDDPDTESRCALTLGAIGAPALEALLAVHERTSSPEKKRNVAVALSEVGVRDDRILRILLREFEDDHEDGASLLACYGDPAALPALASALDGTTVDETDSGWHGNFVVQRLHAVIVSLGGTPTAAQQAKLDLAESLRDEQEADLDTEGDDDADDADDEEGGSPTADAYDVLAGGDDEPDAPGDGGPVSPLVAHARPGRNDPCWCGSGKKYKRCHLAEDESQRA